MLTNPAQTDPQHQSFKTSVGDEQVAAAAEHKDRETTAAGEAYGLKNVGLARCLGKPPRRATDFEGRIGR